jgi:hypothetical protein
MSLKKLLIDRLESQIEVWDKTLEAVKANAERKKAQAKTKKADARIKEEVLNTIFELQENIESAKKRIKEIRAAGEIRLNELKDQINSWLK